MSETKYNERFGRLAMIDNTARHALSASRMARLCVALILFAIAPTAPAAEAPKQPNIVFVLVDDLR